MRRRNKRPTVVYNYRTYNNYKGYSPASRYSEGRLYYFLKDCWDRLKLITVVAFATASIVGWLMRL